jgi:hypothetical protein
VREKIEQIKRITLLADGDSHALLESSGYVVETAILNHFASLKRTQLPPSDALSRQLTKEMGSAEPGGDEVTPRVRPTTARLCRDLESTDGHGTIQLLREYGSNKDVAMAASNRVYALAQQRVEAGYMRELAGVQTLLECGETHIDNSRVVSRILAALTSLVDGTPQAASVYEFAQAVRAHHPREKWLLEIVKPLNSDRQLFESA